MESAGIKRYFGLRRQLPDPRDELFKLRLARRIVDAAPPAFSLSPQFDKVPQEDQGMLGSCGPNTCCESIYYSDLMEGIAPVLPSRLFIYYNTRGMMNTINQDSGVDNRTMLKALAQYGYCNESMWPYKDDPVTFRQKPNQACYQAAAANRIQKYNPVDINYEQVKAVLYSQRLPVLCGFDVFRGITSEQAAMTGIVPDPGPMEHPEGGHDVLIYAYDDNGFGGKFPGPALKFRNHWMNGPSVPWGDRGSGYFSAKYIISPHASDWWVIQDLAGGGMPTPTPPTPIPTPLPVPTPGPNPDLRLGVLAYFAKIEGFQSDYVGNNGPYKLYVK